MPAYGRDDATWDRLVEAGHGFLIERACLGRTTSYTELTTVVARRTGTLPFDFERADERAAMGHLLGLIVERDRPVTGHMISALVNYLDTNDAGPGFYSLAKHLGYTVSSSPNARMDFWIRQLNAVISHYRNRYGTSDQ